MFRKKSRIWTIILYLVLTAACLLVWINFRINYPDNEFQHMGRFKEFLIFVFQKAGEFKDWFYYGMLITVFAALVYGIKKLPARSRLREDFISRERIESFSLNDKFSIKHDLEFVADGVKRALRSFGFFIMESQAGKEIYFWAEKHRLNRWGLFITYLGMLVILSGAMIGKMFGFQEVISAVPGAGESIINRNLSLKMNKDLELEFFEKSNIPKLIRNSVELSEKQKLVKRAEISFNKPLNYKGVRFYHAQYNLILRDAKVEIDIPQRKRKKTRIQRLYFGRKAPIEKTRLSMKLESFVPDYGEDEGGVYSRSPEWNNPAVLISVFKSNEVIGSDWLFELWPDYQKSVFKKNTRYKLRLKELNRVYSSTFFVSYDPGLKIVWVGFGLLMIGVVLRFYLTNRVILVLLRQEKNSTVAYIAGETVRDTYLFEEYFYKIVEVIKKY